jgi:hypothetical protein
LKTVAEAMAATPASVTVIFVSADFKRFSWRSRRVPACGSDSLSPSTLAAPARETATPHVRGTQALLPYGWCELAMALFESVSEHDGLPGVILGSGLAIGENVIEAAQMLRR